MPDDRVIRRAFWSGKPLRYDTIVNWLLRTVWWFRRALAVSVFGAFGPLLMLRLLNVVDDNAIPVKEHVLLNPEAYTSISFILGFIITFRTNQAYHRYWEGATLLEQMMGNWYDAASSLVAFCTSSQADQERIMEFQQVLARLLSLINAVILCELAGEELEPKALKYNLLDVTGLDKETLRLITNTECRPQLIFQKIQTLLVANMANGVLNVPPPILTRAFQQMSNAMLNYHDAMKLRLVPFPAPYIAISRLLALAHVCMTPIMAINWTYTVTQAILLSFAQIFLVVSLLTLANGLDNPFDPARTDLDLEGVHTIFNKHLRDLLEDNAKAPTLSRRAKLALKNLDMRVPSEAIKGSRNLKTLFEKYGHAHTMQSGDSDSVCPQGGPRPRPSLRTLTYDTLPSLATPGRLRTGSEKDTCGDNDDDDDDEREVDEEEEEEEDEEEEQDDSAPPTAPMVTSISAGAASAVSSSSGRRKSTSSGGSKGGYRARFGDVEVIGESGTSLREKGPDDAGAAEDAGMADDEHRHPRPLDGGDVRLLKPRRRGVTRVEEVEPHGHKSTRGHASPCGVCWNTCGSDSTHT